MKTVTAINARALYEHSECPKSVSIYSQDASLILGGPQKINQEHGVSEKVSQDFVEQVLSGGPSFKRCLHDREGWHTALRRAWRIEMAPEIACTSFAKSEA